MHISWHSPTNFSAPYDKILSSIRPGEVGWVSILSQGDVVVDTDSSLKVPPGAWRPAQCKRTHGMSAYPSAVHTISFSYGAVGGRSSSGSHIRVYKIKGLRDAG